MLYCFKVFHWRHSHVSRTANLLLCVCTCVFRCVCDCVKCVTTCRLTDLYCNFLKADVVESNSWKLSHFTLIPEDTSKCCRSIWQDTCCVSGHLVESHHEPVAVTAAKEYQYLKNTLAPWANVGCGTPGKTIQLQTLVCWPWVEKCTESAENEPNTITLISKSVVTRLDSTESTLIEHNIIFKEQWMIWDNWSGLHCLESCPCYIPSPLKEQWTTQEGTDLQKCRKNRAQLMFWHTVHHWPKQGPSIKTWSPRLMSES